MDLAAARRTEHAHGPRGRGRTRAALVAVLTVLGVAATALPAQAAAWPATRPVDVRLTKVTHSSVAVTLAPTANTDTYRLWVTPDKADIWVAAISKKAAGRRSYVSTAPTFSVAGLPYRTTPYYLRLATVKGSNRRYSDIFELWLRPTTPALTVSADASGVALHWPDLAATGHEVRRATDEAFTTGLRVDTVRGRSNGYTPTGVVPAEQVLFQVRAVNGATRSPWSAPVAVTPATAETPLRVVSYNLMGIWTDGHRADGGLGMVSPPWMTRRRPAAAALVRPAAPQIVLVQEGSSYTDGWNSPLQVDTFASTLGGRYVVARTQGRALDPDYALRGVHVVYDGSVLAAVGNGGNWALPDGTFAAWQLLRHKVSGARVLAVSVHLTSTVSAASDTMRRAETTALRDRIAAFRATHGQVPVVTGGDYGSYLANWHPVDAPATVLRAAGWSDARDTAQTLSRTGFSSYNHYRGRPWAGGGAVDRLFTTPGVGVTRWAQLMHLDPDGSYAGVQPSDHDPVVFDVTVPGPAGPS